MAFDREYFRSALQVEGRIVRNYWDYDTADTDVTVAAYFAGIGQSLKKQNMGVGVGDIIRVMEWPNMPNANERMAFGDGDQTDFPAPATDVYTTTAPPTRYYEVMVTEIDLADPESATYGDLTVVAL